jgi:hypothetical protein
MKDEYDLGVVRCHPIIWMWKMCCVIFHTWMFCRKNGLQSNEWIGIYYKGTEKAVAHFGCLPNAADNARFWIAAKKVLAEHEAKP